MHHRLSYFIIILCSGLAWSCQEIIELELPNTDPQLVIEGEVTYWEFQPENNLARVRVATSGNYYDENASIPVTDASVQIEDLTHAQTYDLFPQENEPGLYLNHTIPLDSGNTYRLHVSYSGNIYSSEGTVLPVAELDSFTYKYRENSPLLEPGYYFFFSGRTPKERGINYYRFKIYENDSLYDDPGDYLIQSDEFLQAKIDTLQLSNYSFDLTDTVRIEMYSLNRDVFEYYNQLVELLFNDGGLFSSPPRNPDTNIINVTNPDNPPLGFFQVSSALSGGAVVEDEEE
jgi:hypothetical protein